MPDALLRGKCPYTDCARIILFHEESAVGHPGACPDCLRRFRIAQKAEGTVKLSAERR